ncbi:nuclear transport factor 2 family protein [Flavobacterium sp. FlaQc-57]|uniref:nuclear transport factor 2 family protein n=1 Tax=Flavobacterium sp. FlaQc-57 TaxID=3374186 RepID=UPI0037564005
MRKVFLFISFSFLSFNVNAQVNDATNEWPLVQKTLNMYIEGQATGDSAMVASSFHESWQLKYFAENKFNIVTKSKYIVGYKKHPKSPNWSGRIVFIDITNSVATAKVEISTSKLLFTDYFNLMKINQDWVIVDKISTRTAHRTVEVPAATPKG